MLWAVTSWMGPEPDHCVRGVEGPRKSGCVSGNIRVGGDFPLSCQGKGADLENGHVPRCASQQAKCCVSYFSSCLTCIHHPLYQEFKCPESFLARQGGVRIKAFLRRFTCSQNGCFGDMSLCVVLASSPFCSLMLAQHGAEEVEAFFLHLAQAWGGSQRIRM